MDTHSVTIQDMMHCRERRAALQTEMLARRRCPLVSFCMNIPGPVKTNPQIAAGFAAGKEALLQALENAGAVIFDLTEFHDKTGDELMAAVSLPQADAKRLKDLTTRIEEQHPLGRLFDLDVIDTDGTKLSRPDFRQCLLCSRQAQECARSRRHSVEEMFQKIMELLENYC